MPKRSITMITAVDRFDIKPGRILAGKYEAPESPGNGWKGEVYPARGHPTGIERAVKLFYPQ